MPCLLFSPPNVECGDPSPPSEPCGDECRSPDGAACGAIREDADHKTRITPQAASSGLRTHPIGLNDDQGRQMLSFDWFNFNNRDI